MNKIEWKENLFALFPETTNILIKKIPYELIIHALSYLTFKELRSAILVDRSFTILTLKTLEKHYFQIQKVLGKASLKLNSKEANKCQALDKEIVFYPRGSINEIEKKLFETEEQILTLFSMVKSEELKELRKIPSVFYLLNKGKFSIEEIPTLCKELTRMGRLKKAMQIALSSNNYSNAFKQIISVLTYRGETDKIEGVAKSITQGHSLDFFWREYSEILLETNLQKAEEIALKITQIESQETLLLKICEKSVENGDLLSCERLALSFKSPFYKGKALLYLSEGLRKLKAFDKALDIIALMPKAGLFCEEKEKVHALEFLFPDLKEEKHVERALNLVTELTHKISRETIFFTLISMYLEKDEISYARKALSSFNPSLKTRRKIICEIKEKELKLK